MRHTILCRDGIRWCRANKSKIPAIVTSIPDASEIGLQTIKTKTEEKHYTNFFLRAADAVFQATTDDGYAMFIQTDRKHSGLIDKPFLLSQAAYARGFRMMFHKIALIRKVNQTDLHKPTYTHVICYSKRGTPGKATPDVFPRGNVLYKNGAGVNAVAVCLHFLKAKGITTVADPFVGQGTTLIVAKKMKFTEGIGVDIDPEQCTKADKNISDA